MIAREDNSVPVRRQSTGHRALGDRAGLAEEDGA